MGRTTVRRHAPVGRKRVSTLEIVVLVVVGAGFFALILYASWWAHNMDE